MHVYILTLTHAYTLGRKKNLNFGKTIQLILLFFYQITEHKRKIGFILTNFSRVY